MNAQSAKARKRIDFDRLNHILIPKSRARRERWRRSRAAKLAAPIYALYLRFSAEGRAFGAIALLSTLFALEARRTDAYLLWGILSALLLSSLLFGRTARLSEVYGVVSTPQRITVGDELTFTITIRNESERVLESLRFTGPFLPWDGAWLQSRTALARIAPGRSERATLRARFRERGEPVLGAFHVAALLPLGLSMGPPLWLDPPRFLVVPRRANVTNVTLPKSTKRSLQGSAFAARVGESQDFLGVRPYRPGDPLRDLHARTWARTGVPIVRQYEQENTLEVIAILDTAVEAGSANDEERFEAALEVVCGLAEALTSTPARLGCIVTNESPVLLEADGGLGVDRILDAMAVVQSSTVAFDCARTLGRLASRWGHAALVVLVALRTTSEHEKLREMLLQKGIACRVLLVTADEAENIRSGKAIAL